MDTSGRVVAEVHLKAPAKINLILRVNGRREDGYHELETWMQKVGLYDEIHLVVIDTPEIKLFCSSREIPDDESNLLWKTAALFLSRSITAAGKGAVIHLKKRIPVGAGLGGGSSDAGTLLKALNQVFGFEFSQEELIEMAVSLGADVPFFVTEMHSVFATGIGEKLRQVRPLENCRYILVNPGINVSTAEVFRKFALTRLEKNSKLTGSQMLDPNSLTLADMQNDLETVTEKMYPVIKEIKEELTAAGADKVLMTGSGPTVFGVFLNAGDLKDKTVERAAVRLQTTFGEKVYAV